MKKIAKLAGILLLLGGCNISEDSSKEKNTAEADSLATRNPDISVNDLDNILESIPSPIEFSSLIQNSGAKYTAANLNNTSNIDRYNSQYNKALNLGIYGADLGYINLYEKTYSAIDYLNAVYQLANDLNIGDFFDFATLQRLATNNKNLDSIVYITTVNFEKMHHQLKKNNNSHISVLILVGGWIEGIYLTTQSIQTATDPQDELMLTVYDEKIVLDDLMKLVDMHKNSPNFDKLSMGLSNLKKVYESIVIEKEKISPEQFNGLAKEIKSIRSELIG